MITTGTVNNIKFGDDYGFFSIDETGGGFSVFFLWFFEVSSNGPVALYTMLLTVAAARGLTVEISHDSTSVYVDQVKLLGA